MFGMFNRLRNMIYHDNHNWYNPSQQLAVDEASNIIFSRYCISVLIAQIRSKNNFMIVPFFDSLVFQGIVKY